MIGSYRNLAGSLTVFLSMNSFFSVVAQEASHQVQTSFVLRSDVPLIVEEQLFSADCLKHSFDVAATIQFAQAKMSRVDLKAALRLPMHNRMLSDVESDASADPVFKWNLDWSIYAATSKTQPIDLLFPEVHEMWEAGFCRALRNGPYEIFHDVENCHIFPQNQAETKTGAVAAVLTDHALLDAAAKASEFVTVTNNQEIVFSARASLGLPKDEDTTQEEQAFINECLRQSYDEIHDDDDIHLESADVKQYFTVPHEKRSPTSLTLNKAPYNPNRWTNFDYSYIWQYKITGKCNLCSISMLLARSMEFEDVSGVSKGNKKEQGRWEDSFCDKLRSGPFEKFQKIKSCYIAIYKDDD